MNETRNAERRRPNAEVAETHEFDVRRSTLDVRRLLWRTVELAIGAVFVYAGVLKALDPVGFANDIANYHILPWPIGVRLAFYLPWLEIFCGVALWFRKLTSGALTILSAMTLVFVIASVMAKSRGIDVSCGCFGHASRNLSFAAHLTIDFVILAALLVLLWRDRRAAA